MTMSSFCNLKVVKSAAKILKIGSLVKYLCPKIILNRPFTCAREVIHTPEKKLKIKRICGIILRVWYLAMHTIQFCFGLVHFK